MTSPTAEVTVTNTISRDTGSLKITKSFDANGSGFAGDFSIGYDCNDGTSNDGTVTLAAGASQTINGIPTGTECTVSEPSTPTPPPGWSFGTPTTNPSNGTVTIVTSPTAEVTVTNTISRDTGSLKITKSFDANGSGFAGDFSIGYDCNDGTSNDGTVTLAAGASQTINGIPTGTECTVSEPSTPTPPPGWSFGTPTTNPSNGTVTIVTSPTAEVTVTNTISRDTGSLKITKSFDANGSGFAGDFSIGYDCNDGTSNDGTVTLAAGASQTINGIPTGTECTVSEPSTPTPPPGWSFGTPTTNPSNGTVTIVTSPTAEVTVTNTISRDTGSLKITKSFDANGSGFAGDFSIGYDCNDGTSNDGTVTLAAGASQTINGIPTGTECTVSEPSTPTPPPGWSFGTPTTNPSNGTVTIVTSPTADVTVTNTISRDTGSLKITKTVNAGGSGFTSGTFGFTVACTSPSNSYTASVVYPSPGFAIISNIPTGSQCSVAETSKPSPPSGYSWTTTITPSSVTIGNGTTVEVMVTNTLGKTALTPGYWKNHKAQATPFLPISLGSYNVAAFSLATSVFNKMNCSSSKDNEAIGCLAGHLLAAKLNVANGAGNPCIAAVIAKADAFLAGQTVDGVPGINYTGPNGKYTLTSAQRSLAISLKNALDKYNNNGGCV